MSDIRRKGLLTPEEIKLARESKRQDNLKFIADCVNNHLTFREIRALRPEITYQGLNKMIKELKSSNIITQEQIDENSVMGKKRTLNKDAKLSSEEQAEFVLRKLREGYGSSEIARRDTTGTLSREKAEYHKRLLISNGAISAEEIKEAIAQRKKKTTKAKHEEALAKIKEYTELGYTVAEMTNFISEYKYLSLLNIKREYIKNHGWYSEEELNEFKARRKAREIEEARIAYERLAPEEKEKIEAEKRAKEDERRKKQEELLAKKQKRKEALETRHQQDTELLKKYIKSGKKLKEIAEIMGHSAVYLRQLKMESLESNTWFTEAEQNEIDREKKSRAKQVEKEKRKQKAIERAKKEKEKQKGKRELIKSFKDYIKKGYSVREIAPMLNYSVPQLYYLRRIEEANNEWFSEEELNEFKALRKKREALEQEKSRKREQKRLERERVDKKKLNRAVEEERKTTQRETKIKGYKTLYGKFRKMARKEDRLEMDGEENIPKEGRAKFIETLTELHSLGVSASEKDIELVLNTLYLYPELANKDNIKFLISNANKTGGIESALKITHELTRTLSNTPFYESLVQYGSWMRKKSLFPQIQELRTKGLNYDEIGERLGINSIEVSTIFNEDREIKFSDDEER